MPEPIMLLKLLGISAGPAALVVLLLGWPWKSPNPTCAAIGWVLALTAGFYAGCYFLGYWPKAPTFEQLSHPLLFWQEGTDRLLWIILPSILFVEFVAAFDKLPNELAWLLRFTVAISVARVLLDGSSYLEYPEELGPPKWTNAEATRNFVLFAGALICNWCLLMWLSRRSPGRGVPVALAMTAAGVGLTIMLSGSLTIGLLTIPLGGALGGAALASLALPAKLIKGFLGVGLVLLFSILILGCYNADLLEKHACILFFAPLLCWVTELPYIRNWRLAWRDALCVLVVAIPIGYVGYQAYQSFQKDSKATSTSEDEDDESKYYIK
jgi:hypothetical protein